MNRLALALLAMWGLPLWCVCTAEAKPHRIVSANLCADQLVLALADSEHIAALSFNGKNPAMSYYADKAAAFPSVTVGAEDIMRHQPDLVILGGYDGSFAARLLKRQGIPVRSMAMPESFEQIETQIRDVASWLGEEVRGEALIAKFRAQLAGIPRREEEKPRIALYHPGPYTDGSGTLEDALITQVGGRNVAVEAGIKGMGYLPLETLVSRPPDLLLLETDSSNNPTLGTTLLSHPALRGRAMRTLPIPAPMLICGNHLYGELVQRVAREGIGD